MQTIPAHISCDMQGMPCNTSDPINKMQHESPQPHHKMDASNNSDCNDMDNCNDCNISCLSSFINYNNKLHLDTHKQSNELDYALISPPQQHPDNLYRPPLIN